MTDAFSFMDKMNKIAVNEFYFIKQRAVKLFDQLEQVIEVVGGGIILSENKDHFILSVDIYEKQFCYLNLLVDEFEGVEVVYEFTEYPQFA